MRNEYTSSEIIEIGDAQFVVQGAKDFGTPDWLTGSEVGWVSDPTTDIDE